jgi:hypothetical protein
MNMRKIIAIILAAGFLLTMTVACEKEGTAEKAGKQIDRALDSAKQKLDEATK